MKNIGVVQLSDGRFVQIEAEHNGRVEATLVYDVPTPIEAHAYCYQHLTAYARSRATWEAAVREEHARAAEPYRLCNQVAVPEVSPQAYCPHCNDVREPHNVTCLASECQEAEHYANRARARMRARRP